MGEKKSGLSQSVTLREHAVLILKRKGKEKGRKSSLGRGWRSLHPLGNLENGRDTKKKETDQKPGSPSSKSGKPLDKKKNEKKMTDHARKKGLENTLSTRLKPAPSIIRGKRKKKKKGEEEEN